MLLAGHCIQIEMYLYRACTVIQLFMGSAFGGLRRTVDTKTEDWGQLIQDTGSMMSLLEEQNRIGVR